ncbi:MAG: endonuclease VII domain-containing protein, partial [Achromobacter mucicolens]
LKSYCITCERAYNAERSRRHYHAHPELKEKSNLSSRRVNLRKKYGITPECYDKMFSEQGGACAICGTDQPGGRHKYFSVDHDHETGAIRGLLCNNCNRGVGLLGDSEQNMRAAANYLSRHKAPTA